MSKKATKPGSHVVTKKSKQSVQPAILNAFIWKDCGLWQWQVSGKSPTKLLEMSGCMSSKILAEHFIRSMARNLGFQLSLIEAPPVIDQANGGAP